MFWLLDVSGSMVVGGKIDALNRAVADAITSARQLTRSLGPVRVLMRAIVFAEDAGWWIPEPVDCLHLTWRPVTTVARGTTETGRAISLAASALASIDPGRASRPPALILVSDGKPTDRRQPTYRAALRQLDQLAWGPTSTRVAIGIGDDADTASLQRFVGHSEIPPLRALSTSDLSRCLSLATTIAVEGVTMPIPTVPNGEISADNGPSDLAQWAGGERGWDDRQLLTAGPTTPRRVIDELPVPLRHEERRARLLADQARRDR